MKAYFLTDQGQVRDHNEDTGGIFANNDNQLIAVIADGMGGHKAGDIASEMVVNHISEKWKSTNYISAPDQAESWLSSTIVEINNMVYSYAQDHKGCQGMGTTVVAVIFSEEFISIGHIGDSRCYLENSQGFNQITEDHSLVNELVKTGQISKNDAEYHPRKNVLLKAVGTELDVQADVQTIGWERQNMALLCSDGLTNKLSDQDLLEFIHIEQPIETIAKRLIDEANQRGGEDNISLAIIYDDDLPEEGES